LLGFDTRYVPLHPYFVRAMDAVWEHLRNGAAPAAGDAIAFGSGTLTVPD